MQDQVLAIPLTEALEYLSTPDGVHHLALRNLPDLRGVSRTARAALGVLFRLALPTELGGQAGHVTIRYRGAPPIKGAQSLETPDGLAAGQRLTVRAVAEKRREDESGRTRIRAVRDEEAEDWARALLGRHGLEVCDLKVSPRWFLGSRGQRSFMVRDLTATVTAVQEEAVRAYVSGIGRGKAFGYGMPIVL